MSVIFLLIVGAAAGFVATRMLKMDIPVVPTIAIGVLGALIGGFVLRFLASALGTAFGFVGAVAGAVLLIVLYQHFFGKGGSK